MAQSKEEILKEFDILLRELENFIEGIDSVPGAKEWGNITPSYAKNFYPIRTRFLKILNGIDSKDQNLRSAIDYLREIAVNEFNVDNVYRNMLALRSDFEADTLTKYPRLVETPNMPIEKQRWLDEPKAIVIAAIIGAIALIGTGIAATVINQNSILNNSLVLTYTPSPSATLLITSTQSPTEEVTFTP